MRSDPERSLLTSTDHFRHPPVLITIPSDRLRFLALGNRTTDQSDSVHGPSVVPGLVPAIMALGAPLWTGSQGISDMLT
jgi:hypothetical protein